MKHIRNGIAHGNVNVTGNKNQKQYIEINDFNRVNYQTAQMYFPLKCLIEIYNVYMEVEKT